MIADLQPLIKFELHSHQLEDSAVVEKDQSDSFEQNQHAQYIDEASQSKKLNTSRRRTLRPSLGSIPEELSNAESIAALTSNASLTLNATATSVYTSSRKQRCASVEKLQTPTKVASSPMSKFTMVATPNAGQFEITNGRGDFRIPHSPIAEKAVGHCDTWFESRGHYQEASPAMSRSTPCLMESVSVSTNEITEDNPYQASAPIFDQPVGQAQAEPEYEFKRRISLNNARRSDRRSSVNVYKKMGWIASSNTRNRRHSDMTWTLEKFETSKRRHTLDVDVARNLDIFAQPLPQPGPEIAQDESTFDIKFKEFQRKTAKRKPSRIADSDMSAEIDEEVIKLYLDPDSAVKSGRIECFQAPETSPQKYTPGEEIPWDNFKLFAGVNLSNTINDTQEMIPANDADAMNVVVLGSAVADAFDVLYESQRSTNVPMSQDEGKDGKDQLNNQETHARIDNSVDMGSITEESADIHTKRSTMERLSDASRQERDACENPEGAPVAIDETVATVGEKDTTEDESALALLHNFVRRVQTSKEGKQNLNQDTVPILSTIITKKRSPIAGIEGGSNTPSPRKPLGARDTNKSPSPKKRKLGETEDAPLGKMNGRLAKPDLEDVESSQPKKRRRRMETDTDDVFNPEMDTGQILTQKSQGVARRSSRIATTRSNKTEHAQSVFSTIPVRLPGSSGMLHDPDMPTVSTNGINSAVLQRKIEKDLATETRTNTRRNKGGAVPVPVALVALTKREQPAGESVIEGSSNKTRLCGKTVRWDAVLARVQGEEEPTPVTSSDVQDDAVDENLPSLPQMRHVGLGPENQSRKDQLQEKNVTGPPTPSKLQSRSQSQSPPEPEKKLLPRRSTRSSTTSRLPRSSIGPIATHKQIPLPAPPRIVNKSERTSVAGRLGTPAPKRRGARR